MIRKSHQNLHLNKHIGNNEACLCQIQKVQCSQAQMSAVVTQLRQNSSYSLYWNVPNLGFGIRCNTACLVTTITSLAYTFPPLENPCQFLQIKVCLVTTLECLFICLIQGLYPKDDFVYPQGAFCRYPKLILTVVHHMLHFYDLHLCLGCHSMFGYNN